MIFSVVLLQLTYCKGQQAEQAIRVFPTAESLLPNNYITEGNSARLNLVFAKAQKGGKMVIGALGGSITEGAASATVDKRYPNVVLAWWKKKFPKAMIELVNAGIGATGSDYGAMRVKRDLLSYSPDFVVVDYAVNDPNTKEYAEAYEGVVRQILNAAQKPALMLLFMTKNDGSNAQEWQSKVGIHYNLSMTSYRDAIWPEIKSGRLKWEQISPDQVHPNEAGHVLTGELICMALDKAFKKFSPENIPSVNLPIPSAFFSGSFEFTSVFDGEALVPISNKNWVFDGSQPKIAGWKSSVPGSIIEFEINGTVIFLSCWRINGPMGKAVITVDGTNPVIMDAWFDQTWGGYRYMLPIRKNLLSEKHIVRIELMAEKNAQSTGTEFRVLCLGSAGIEK